MIRSVHRCRKALTETQTEQKTNETLHKVSLFLIKSEKEMVKTN